VLIADAYQATSRYISQLTLVPFSFEHQMRLLAVLTLVGALVRG
jgi:hypothetical protein